MFNLTAEELALFAVHSFGAMQKPQELAALLHTLETQVKPETILEIGVGKAGTSWALSKLPTVKHMIAVDLPGGPWGGGPQESALKYIASNSPVRYDFIAGNSASSECLEAVRKLLGDSQIDFLFIDGDHSYNGVKTDMLTYKPLVRPGGCIAFHDIVEHAKETGCEVDKFWKEVKEGTPPENYFEIIEQSKGWAGIGLIRA